MTISKMYGTAVGLQNVLHRIYYRKICRKQINHMEIVK